MERCSKLAEDFAKFLNLSEKDIYILKTGGLYHDIGKLRIDYKILYKKGKLNKKEFDVIKKHTEIELDRIKNKDIVDIIRQHHEREDGSGYPRGLKSNEINYYAKIISIIDVFEALNSKRAYKKYISKEEAIKIICNQENKFDKNLLIEFINFIKN